MALAKLIDAADLARDYEGTIARSRGEEPKKSSKEPKRPGVAGTKQRPQNTTLGRPMPATQRPMPFGLPQGPMYGSQPTTQFTVSPGFGALNPTPSSGGFVDPNVASGIPFDAFVSYVAGQYPAGRMVQNDDPWYAWLLNQVNPSGAVR